MNIEILKSLLDGKNIIVSEFIENNKASEAYVRTAFVQDDGFEWETVVPYVDRRAGRDIKTEQELAEYLVSIKPYFRKKAMADWKKQELKRGLIGGSVTPQFKTRVIRLLKERNAFEARVTPKKALMPDHKFSEVRWDEETKVENSMEMTDEQIIQKFQLLDNQRNQQKREMGCKHS